MKTHKGKLYLWFEGDTEKRELLIEVSGETTPEQSALELCAERNREIIAEVFKQVRWSVILQNVKSADAGAVEGMKK